MTLKLANEKIEIVLMEVPELIKETSIHYIFEAGTEHLHPVLFIGNKEYKENHIVIELPVVFEEVIHFTVKLFDDNQKVIRIYETKLAYNKYQITGIKPIRPDFEKYIHVLESKVLSLELTVATLKEDIQNLIIKHKEDVDALISTYEGRIKELEEKGEIV